MEMKYTRCRVWIVLLLVISLLVWSWTIWVAAHAKDILLMFNTAAPSSPLYEKMLRDVTRVSTLLLLSSMIPAAVVNVLWLFAFLGERREVNRLKRQQASPEIDSAKIF